MLIGVLASCNTLKKTALNRDTKSDQLITQGKRFLQDEQYEQALDAFEMARARTFNQSTTAAIYLSGLTAYYLQYDEIASQRFATILEEYPKSKFVDDATFHDGLIHLRSRSIDTQLRGLIRLMTLSRSTKNKQIGKDADDQVREKLFYNSGKNMLESFYNGVPGDFQSIVLEAWIHRLMEEKNYVKAQELYDNYLSKGGTDTEFLKSHFPGDGPKEEKPKAFEADIMRFALFLPLYLNNGQISFMSEIPEQSVRALEFYEGFQMAIEEFQLASRKKIFVKVFDTRRDTFATKLYLKDLDLLQPNVVVGGIYNSQSRILSDWAESRKIPQMIPLSPSLELVEGKQYTFLAHPAAYTHGARMAEYAWTQLNLIHTCVFSDRQSGTDELARGYIETFTQYGGTIDSLFFSADYELSVEQIPDLVDYVRDDTLSNGVYIPLMGNEEAAGLIVNVLKQRGKNVVLMGSPHFKSRYNTLARETKEDFQMLYSTSHMHDENGFGYKNLYRKYLEKYEYPISDNVIQGYDMGMYLFNTLDKFDPNLGISLDSYLRLAPAYESLHLDYKFQSEQSNQGVNIGKYIQDGMIRVYR